MPGMTVIAHLSDLHLLEPEHKFRDTGGRARLAFLSFGRPLDAEERRARASRALEQARSSRADHVVITGDLTEDGADAQFEVLAEVLAESRIPADEITLVPGNHDAYTEMGAWSRALQGPLRPYARTSATGAVTTLRGATLFSVSTVMQQGIARSAGSIDDEQLDRIRRLGSDRALASSPLVALQHHPPFGHMLPAVQWIDGLREHARMMAVLEELPNVHVLHGHSHKVRDKSVRSDEPSRIFSAHAVVECDDPVRFYEADNGQLVPVADDLPCGLALNLAEVV